MMVLRQTTVSRIDGSDVELCAWLAGEELTGLICLAWTQCDIRKVRLETQISVCNAILESRVGGTGAFDDKSSIGTALLLAVSDFHIAACTTRASASHAPPEFVFVSNATESD
jgi:hypothetical protein